MKAKKILLGGMPASGKGTQADMLCQKLGYPHLGTGLILRNHLEKGSDLVEGYTKEEMDAGKLAPIEVIERIIAHELENNDTFILDGFPRTEEQWKFMVKHTDIDIILFLNINQQTAKRRMMNRGRSDDNPDAITDRIITYFIETEPLIVDHFVHETLYYVDGEQSPDAVNQEIMEYLAHHDSE